MPLPLMPLQVFTPVDVIVLDTQGLVSQLIPNVVLAGLSQEIVASRPTKAFLYMKAGTIEVYALEPNDRVEHPYFRPHLERAVPDLGIGPRSIMVETHGRGLFFEGRQGAVVALGVVGVYGVARCARGLASTWPPLCLGRDL